MVILSDKQWDKVSKQLDEIKEIKDTVRQIFFHLNSFHISYNCDQIKQMNKDQRVAIDEMENNLEKLHSKDDKKSRGEGV